MVFNQVYLSDGSEPSAHPIHLAGSRILVVGALSGLGIALGAYLRRCGAVLHGTARSPVDGSSYEKLFTLDLENLQHQCAAKIGHAVDYKPYDGVVFCAGIVSTKPVSHSTVYTLTPVMHVNAIAQIAFLAQLKKAKLLSRPCSVVFVSSIASDVLMPGNAPYSASKAALDVYAKSAAIEMARSGVRVNTVSPGHLETPMTDKLSFMDEDAKEKDKKKYPLGYGTPEAVCPSIAFLLSDLSSWMTGADITIDGGRSLTS